MIYKKYFAPLFLILLLSLSFVACAENNSLQKKYGAESFYFLGLQSLEKKDIDKAEFYFHKAGKKSSSLIAEKSLQELSKLGTVKDRQERLIKLYKKFPTEENLLLLSKELFLQKEYGKIINYTNKINLKECDNELAYYRIISLFEKKSTKFNNEFIYWCTQKNYTSFHHKVFLKLESVNPLIEFRDNIYTKQFDIASTKIVSILEDKNNYLPQIFSDIGKAFLYKSNDHLKNAIYLDSKLEEVPDECKFYLLFYSGRLYDKSNDYKTKASLRFKSAIELARDKLKNNSLQDNALWYYFNTCLKISIDKTIFALEENINEIHDPYYFDDFFDTLSLRLISEHQWKNFYTITKILNTNVSSETRAKFNYISARLIEEKFINSSNEISLNELYNIALQSESDIYYRLMAAKKLNLSEEELKENIFSIGKKSKLKINLEAEKLLYGYTDFGLTKYIYPEWTKYSNQISMECTERIADYLQRYANFSIEYFPLSLRIASKKTFSPEKKLSKQLLELSFPKNFKKEIEEVCKEFNIPEYIFYSLVRSESFFNAEVKSHAGANGLSQLMLPTAKDVARKLKISEYNLNDPYINLRLGCAYLDEMIRKTENSILLGCFSYNAGRKKVLSWVKTSRIEFNNQSLPKDLFLEALPFSETREYGRKIISASCMYAYLYYDKNIYDLIEEILK